MTLNTSFAFIYLIFKEEQGDYISFNKIQNLSKKKVFFIHLIRIEWFSSIVFSFYL